MTVKELLYRKLGLSHAQVVRLKKDERGIMLNGERVTVIARVSDGDVLELATEDSEEDINPDIMPVRIPLDILYEDEHIICVDKPSGMPTHPSHGHHDDTLANALCYYYKQQGRPFVFRAVNRLDSETSGVVLIAKDRTSAQKLGAALQRGEFVKKYLAVVKGSLENKEGCIETYIRRKEDSIIFRENAETGIASEYARTCYRVEGEEDGNTLVEVTPITGRTHQIRLHFCHIGHPILGDSLYAESGERLMLHAESLEFPHPETGKRLKVSACTPVGFYFLKHLFEKGK